ncbi:MAG TPA: DUF6209 family protein [Polyangiaceae bacterium]|nr:DUF6209 family protein [Polyangiaceae bacterium]
MRATWATAGPSRGTTSATAARWRTSTSRRRFPRDATGTVDGRIPLTEGGDLAVWFEVTSLGGCQAYASQYSQNYHVKVSGPHPGSDATLVFRANGEVEAKGELHAGGKVSVRAEDARLPKCRDSRAGAQAWAVRGSAQLNGGAIQTFDTGRAVDAKGTREAVDAIDVFGCSEYDSQGAKNYRFRVGN